MFAETFPSAAPIESEIENFSVLIASFSPATTTVTVLAPTPQASLSPEAGPEKVITASLRVGVMLPALKQQLPSTLRQASTSD